MLKHKITRTFLIFLVFYFMNSAVMSAAGISVSPAELSISNANSQSVAKLNVKNPSREVLLFEVYPDALESLISITPSSFILESGADRNVFINAKKSGDREEKHETFISVVAKPLNSSVVQTGSGVKIPLLITMAQSEPLLASLLDLRGNLWVGIPVILTLLFFAIVFCRYSFNLILKKP